MGSKDTRSSQCKLQRDADLEMRLFQDSTVVIPYGERVHRNIPIKPIFLLSSPERPPANYQGQWVNRVLSLSLSAPLLCQSAAQLILAKGTCNELVSWLMPCKDWMAVSALADT